MDRKSIFYRRLPALFAVVLILCACSNKKAPEDALPTPHTVPYTAQPTDIALPEDEFLAVPDVAQMKAQVKRGTPWYLRVDACNQMISVYARDENKNYTLLVNRFVCSVPEDIDPLLLQSGQTCPLVKAKWEQDTGAAGYSSEFCVGVGGQLSFHSVPVKDMDQNMPDVDTYNHLTLGTDKPYIVLSAQDAGWLYENLREGAFFEVVYDNPDPDLVQSLIPMPYVEGCGIPYRKEAFTICMTSEPQIAWTSMNETICRIPGSE